ncbi:MAG: S8 family serine peptidase [Ignisphaera sp.]
MGSSSYRTLDGRRLNRLFSGTSQATPMVAGVGALVVSAYKRVANRAMPAHLLKTILMNTAYDMGFDELSQGVGSIDAYRAVTSNNTKGLLNHITPGPS